jgi:hypothetical protein
VPPIILIARVLKKMESCKARGVLVAPEWKSANYWPMLCGPVGVFRPFVKDWIYLPVNKHSYTPCINGVGIFGNEDLRFSMMALYIDFTV